MKTKASRLSWKAAPATALQIPPVETSLVDTFLALDSAMKASAVNLIDALTRDQSTRREFIPIDEQRHFPADDVFDPVTGAQYFLHRHAAGNYPESVHLHFFQRWTPAELSLPEAETISTHLAGLALNTRGEPHAWFVVNQWVVGDYWQPADDTIRLFSDWKITTPDVARGNDIPDICHQWLAAYLKLNLSATIYPLLRERDALLDKLVDTHPGVNVLEDQSYEVLGYQPIDFNVQLAEWKRASATAG